MSYRLPADYQRQTPAAFNDLADDGKVWQPDVYPHAAAVAVEVGVDNLLDVGCGACRKLAPLDGFNLFGVDRPEIVAQVDAPSVALFGCDLETSWPAEVADLSDGRSVVICSDVIEHLNRPDVLVSHLLDFGSVVVLSTPDRVLTHGDGNSGPPPNPAHAQEWTLSELLTWLSVDMGAKILTAGHTRSFEGSDNEATCLVVFEGRA